MDKKAIIDSLKDGLIVSCQAVPSEPHYMPGVVPMFARCAQWAGAAGLRIDTPDNVREVKAQVDLPVIGLWKIDRGVKDVYITPHFDAARQLWEAGAEIVAPTMYGYVKAGVFTGPEIKDAPDYRLLRDIVDAVEGTGSMVIMEGKVATPEIAIQCLYMGAHAVVVGNAITRPHITAKRFARALDRFHNE